MFALLSRSLALATLLLTAPHAANAAPTPSSLLPLQPEAISKHYLHRTTPDPPSHPLATLSRPLALSIGPSAPQQQQPPSLAATPVRQGLNFDDCTSTLRCLGNRVCLTARNNTLAACAPGSAPGTCFCRVVRLEDYRCETSATCDPGERCVRSTSGPALSVCSSCANVPNGAEGFDDGRCSETPSSGPAQGSSPPSGDALNYDGCNLTTTRCKSPRVCIDSSQAANGTVAPCSPSSVAPAPGRDACFCVQSSVEKAVCTTSNTCDAGERCIRLPSGNRLCQSCAFAAQPPESDGVDEGNCAAGGAGGSSDLSPSPGPEAGETPGPEEMDPSTEPTVPDTEPTTAAPTTVAGEAATTTTTAATTTGAATETSTTTEGGATSTIATTTTTTTAATTTTTTTSGSTSNSGGTTTTAPCISVDHLEHLPRSALVFAEHRTADVLCDRAGSCATAGHVVVYGGGAMMMQTYCARHAPCVARRGVLVNSPRMAGVPKGSAEQRGAQAVRVASRTEGLVFTALSARFGTRAEERVMQALVRFGW